MQIFLKMQLYESNNREKLNTKPKLAPFAFLTLNVKFASVLFEQLFADD